MNLASLMGKWLSIPIGWQRPRLASFNRRAPAILGLSMVLSSCAAKYENTALRAWTSMKSGQIDSALQEYEKEVTRKEDSLLRLMDEGMLLRVGGRFKESNDKFFAAAKIIEMNGYMDVSEEAISLVSNERQTRYQGEDFEKVLVHVYLALNFLELKDEEGALVEMRRVNEILYKMISEAKRPYEYNSFAKYMGGILFENDRDWNNAAVSYRQIRAANPDWVSQWSSFSIDLLRTLKGYGSEDEYSKLEKELPKDLLKRTAEIRDSKMGSLVVVYECGKSPKKNSTKEYHHKTGKGGSLLEVMVPVSYYERRSFSVRRLQVEVDDEKASSFVLNDIEKTAMEHLKDRMGRVIAKALLTAGVKAGIATGIGMATDSKELGLITGIALMLASEADTRSWLTLPANLQISKLFLKPGKHQVTLRYLNAFGVMEGEENISVDIKPSRATIIQRRSFD